MLSREVEPTPRLPLGGRAQGAQHKAGTVGGAGVVVGPTPRNHRATRLATQVAASGDDNPSDSPSNQIGWGVAASTAVAVKTNAIVPRECRLLLPGTPCLVTVGACRRANAYK